MSKLIVEMEMPKSCPCDLIGIGYAMCCSAANTRKRIDEYNECVKNGTRPSWCPISGVLPDEHGDLIDVDTVLWEVPDDEGIVPPMPFTIGDAIEGYDVPIVIAAERKDDGNGHWKTTGEDENRDGLSHF